MKNKVNLVLSVISICLISFFSFSQQKQFDILIRDSVNGELYGIDELLTMGLPDTDHSVDCKSTWGIFYFRINYKGKVDHFFTDKECDLDSMITNRIKSNIFKTEGHWKISKKVKKGGFCWFVFPYFRYSFNHKGCTDAEIEVKKQISRFTYILEKFHGITNATTNSTLVISPANGGFEKE